jgi:hypothetical protein
MLGSILVSRASHPAPTSHRIGGSDSAFTYNYTSQGTCEIIKSGSKTSVPVTISARVGGDGPSSQPIVAPDATHTTDPGSAQVNTPPPPEKKGLMQKLVENAQYQQQKQQGNVPAASPSGNKPLCKMSDSDVHLVDGNWSGPNCIAVDANGKPAHPEDVQQQSDAQNTQRRAEYIESHSCMTTDGAGKANDLVEECN